MAGPSFNADPHLVEQIAGNAQMRAEQGPGWLSKYGGPSGYQALARLPDNAKNVFFSVVSGSTDPSQIAIDTGLNQGQINAALNQLSNQGLVGNAGTKSAPAMVPIVTQ